MSESQQLWLVTWCVQRDFADRIKWRILRWGEYPGLHPWAQCDYTGPDKREAGGPEAVVGNRTMETGLK